MDRRAAHLVFRQMEMAAAGSGLWLAEASAGKLSAAQTGMEVARDAKVLQIYAGTDEIQISQIARSLLA